MMHDWQSLHSVLPTGRDYTDCRRLLPRASASPDTLAILASGFIPSQFRSLEWTQMLSSPQC